MAERSRTVRAALAVCAVAIIAAALTLLLPLAGASAIRAWFDALPAGEQRTVDTVLKVLGPAVSGLALALSVLVHRRRTRRRENQDS